MLEKDQATREEQLKTREDRVANAKLAERQKKMQEEADAKVQLAREELSNDYKDKLMKQEEHFTTKRKELQDRINALEKEEKRLTTRFESAREAQTRAERRVTDLERDLGDLQQQVAPVVGLVEEARSNTCV